MRRPSARGERGFTLLLLLALVLVASTVFASAMGRMQVLARERVRSRASERAFWAAQGALERARVALAADPGWRGGAVALGESRGEVEVGTPEGDPSVRTLRARGFDPGLGTEATAARRTVVAVLHLGPGGPRVAAWREEP